MGASSSRHRRQPQAPAPFYPPPSSNVFGPPPVQQQGQPQPPRPAGQQQQQQHYPPAHNGQYYGGYMPQPGPQYHHPQPYGMGPHHPGQHPPPPGYGHQQPVQYPGHYGQRPVATHEYHQTSTIKNQVNLKKQTLKLVPLPGEGAAAAMSIQFSFDASAPCRVSTFVNATEEPKRSCKLTLANGAQPRTPVAYAKGLDLKFPCSEAAQCTHTVPGDQKALQGMALEKGDTFPIIIRLEALTDDAVKEGKNLSELPPGESLPTWVQAQTTYARVRKDDDGTWSCVVIKQKIWVKGVSYELQEIYGMEQNRTALGTPAALPVDDVDGRECVICLSNERDTTALPCRHMCMCQECAGALKTQTNRCPICRNEIESLLHIKIQRRSPAPGASSSSSSAAKKGPEGGAAPAPGVPAAAVGS